MNAKRLLRGIVIVGSTGLTTTVNTIKKYYIKGNSEEEENDDEESTPDYVQRLYNGGDDLPY